MAKILSYKKLKINFSVNKYLNRLSYSSYVLLKFLHIFVFYSQPPILSVSKFYFFVFYRDPLLRPSVFICAAKFHFSLIQFQFCNFKFIKKCLLAVYSKRFDEKFKQARSRRICPPRWSKNVERNHKLVKWEIIDLNFGKYNIEKRGRNNKMV